MIFYAIRHKATGLLMPQSKRDRGYSHWNPAVHTVDNSGGMVSALDMPRLLTSRKKASRCIAMWFAYPNSRYGPVGRGDYEGMDYDLIPGKEDGRRPEDLEVVEFELVER